MREQSCSIPRGLKINKNSAEGEVFLVDFPSYRTLWDYEFLSRISYCRFSQVYGSPRDCKGKANGKNSCAQMYCKGKHCGISRFFPLP
jgi:hypothetical protein